MDGLPTYTVTRPFFGITFMTTSCKKTNFYSYLHCPQSTLTQRMDSGHQDVTITHIVRNKRLEDKIHTC